jgi:hypothetical protein
MNINLPADFVNVPVQLYYPKPTALTSVQNATATTQILMYARFPKGTSIWGARNGVITNRVEIPQGTQRFYDVLHVDSVHRGFPNEYLQALLLMGSQWPVPLPLPAEEDEAPLPEVF